MIKKNRKAALATAVLTAAAVFASCGSDGGLSEINVISREEGSGTRGAFTELVGISEKDADGNETDNTTDEAMICKSTDVMLTQVAGDLNSIGYVSYGSLNDTVKAVSVDGVAAAEDTVASGEYPIVRPFNIIWGENASEAAGDFIKYIMSAEGQEVVTGEKYAAADSSAASYEASSVSGKVTVAGSSSVSPVMEKLAEEYMEINSNVTIEINTSDSTTGVRYAQDGTCDIGMVSRELADDETGVTAVTIAYDAIAVIVNPDNGIDNLTMEQIKSVYTGEITEWAELDGGETE